MHILSFIDQQSKALKVDVSFPIGSIFYDITHYCNYIVFENIFSELLLVWGKG